MSTTPSSAVRSQARAAFGVVLVMLAIGAVAYGLVRESGKRRLAAESQSTDEQAPPLAVTGTERAAHADAPITTVYYFHGDTRCPTCLSIEKQASEAVQSQFAEQIAAGRMRFLSVNYDTPEHRHFREDFDLSFGSVVVAQGTRFENLNDVWTLVHDDRPVFDAYVVEHVAQFMKSAP